MPELTMGANAQITENSGELLLEWPASAGSLDCSAFLLSANGRVRSDGDMIFFNQRRDADGCLCLVSPDGGDHARFKIDLTRAPADVDRIMVCATVDRDDRTMESFLGLEATLRSGPSCIRFRPDLRGAREAALRVVEIYRRGGGWKMRADGQGYNAGLGPLAESFGVDVEGAEPAGGTIAPPSAMPMPAPMPISGEGRPAERPSGGAVEDDRTIVFDVQPIDVIAAPKAAPRPAGTSLLERGVTATLTSSNETAEGQVRAVLSWSSRQGGAEGRARPLRLRLGAFYETRAGRRGAVQEPDVRQAPPGDDLMTLVTTREADGDRDTLVVSAGRMPEIGTLHLYAILDGASSWRSSHVELLVTVPGNAPVAMELSGHDDGCSCVLIAILRTDTAGSTLQHLARAAVDQRGLDADMGWNLRWKSAIPS